MRVSAPLWHFTSLLKDLSEFFLQMRFSAVSFLVSVHSDQPPVCHGAMHAKRVLRLHAACCHAPQRHSLLLWIPEGRWHGEYTWVRKHAPVTFCLWSHHAPPLPFPQARTGIVMNIIGILCITLAINSWGKAMFDLDTYPAWANATGVWGRSGCRTWSMHALPLSPTSTRPRQQVGATTQDVWANRRGSTVPRWVPWGSSEPSCERQWSPTGEGQKAVICFFFFLFTLYNSKDIFILLYQAHEEPFSQMNQKSQSSFQNSEHHQIVIISTWPIINILTKIIKIHNPELFVLFCEKKKKNRHWLLHNLLLWRRE